MVSILPYEVFTKLVERNPPAAVIMSARVLGENLGMKFSILAIYPREKPVTQTTMGVSSQDAYVFKEMILRMGFKLRDDNPFSPIGFPDTLMEQYVHSDFDSRNLTDIWHKMREEHDHRPTTFRIDLRGSTTPSGGVETSGGAAKGIAGEEP